MSDDVTRQAKVLLAVYDAKRLPSATETEKVMRALVATVESQASDIAVLHGKLELRQSWARAFHKAKEEAEKRETALRARTLRVLQLVDRYLVHNCKSDRFVRTKVLPAVANLMSEVTPKDTDNGNDS